MSFHRVEVRCDVGDIVARALALELESVARKFLQRYNPQSVVEVTIFYPTHAPATAPKASHD